MSTIVTGFDIGGTKCAVSVGALRDGDIEIADRRAIETPDTWQEAVVRLFCLANELLGWQKPAACGFSCGGPLDAARGVVLSPPNLPGWDEVPLTELCQRHFGAPARLENDANACALAEWRWGAGRGSRDMAFLTFGTGLGAGLILNGQLVRGASGNAGEVGHVRLAPFGPAGYGKAGSFEGFCSGGGLAQLAVTMGRAARQAGHAPSYYHGDWEAVTAKDVAQAARAGDPTAKSVFDLCGEKLGEGLSLLVDIIDPEVIVIGSIFTRCEDLLRPAMEAAMAREALSASLGSVCVVPAALGERIGDYAALSCAVAALGGA